MPHLNNTPSATRWVAGGIVVKQGMRLFSNLIMTRILTPEAFGLMAIVNLMLQALNMLSDVGINKSVIRSEREDVVFLQTAWSLQVVRGLLLWLMTLLMAWPVSQYYDEPLLLFILPCSGTIALFMGLNSIAILQNQKHLKYKKLVIFENVAALVGLIAMIFFGILYNSVWALVAGGILSTLVMTFFSHNFFKSIKHSFRWNKEVVHELFHFGKWVFLSTALTFFVSQYDKLALGKLADMHALGLYAIAVVWAGLPTMIVSQLSNKVFYPVVSELYRNGELVKITDIRNSIVILSVVICIFMIASGHLLINVLYEVEYHLAGELVSVLAVLAFFQIIENINTNLLMTVGRPKDKIISQIAGILILVVFLSPLYSSFGMLGIAFLASVSMMLRAYILDIQLRKDKINNLLFDFGMTILLLMLGTISYLLIVNFSEYVSDVLLLITGLITMLLTLIFVFLKQQTLRNLMNV